MPDRYVDAGMDAFRGELEDEHAHPDDALRVALRVAVADAVAERDRLRFLLDDERALRDKDRAEVVRLREVIRADQADHERIVLALGEQRDRYVAQLRRARRWLLAAQAQATGGRRSTIEGHIRELDETLRNG